MVNERPHTRYKKVYFDEDWLEDQLLTALEIMEEALRSNSQFAKDKGKRAVFFWAMRDYGGMSVREMCDRYGQYNAVVHGAINQVVAGNFFKEKTEALRWLEPYLPAAQVEK